MSLIQNDQPLIELRINNERIRSKGAMNVLGVLFDSKLQWAEQVAQSIKKAKKALYAVRIIKHYFNKVELRQLLTSNYFSILYYNSEVWHLPSLHVNLKQYLLAASSAALKLCENKAENKDIL